MAKVSRYLAALLVWACATRGWCDDPVVPAAWPVEEAKKLMTALPEEISAQAEGLVARIASPDFAVREAASKELAEKGAGAFRGLWEAARKKGDPEVEARIRPYFWSGLFRIPTSAPAKVTPVIEDFVRLEGRRTRDGLTGSVRLGSYDISDEMTVQTLHLLREQGADKALVNTMLDDVRLSGTRARLAMLDGRMAEAEEILRQAAAGKGYLAVADYAAFVAMRRGDGLDPQRELELAKLPGPAADELSLMLYRAKGDREKAAEQGRKLPGQWQSTPALLEARMYKELAADLKRGTNYTFEAIAHELAGDEKESRRVLQSLKDLGAAGRSVGMQTSASLIRAGEINDVLAMAKDSQPDQWMAADLLVRQLRVAEAVTILNQQKHPSLEAVEQLIELGFTKEARRILGRIVPDEAELKDKAAAYQADLGGLLERAGDAAGAEKWRLRAGALVDDYRARAAALEKKRRELNDQLRAAQEMPVKDLARQREADLRNKLNELALGANKAGGPYDQAFSVRFYPATATVIEFQEAASLMDNGSFRIVPQGTTTMERFRVMQAVFKGEYSGDELMKYLNVDPKSSVIEWQLRTLARSFQRVQGEDLAIALLEKVYHLTRDPSPFSILGDWALAQGRSADAVEWYKKAALINLTNPSLLYRLGLAYARWPGREAEGARLKALVPWLVLGNLHYAEEVSLAMRQFGETNEAEQWEAYMDRHGKHGGGELGDHFARQRDYAVQRGDYGRALEFAERKLFYAPQGYSREDDYLVAAMRDRAAYERVRALEAWSRKDFALVAGAVMRHLENAPPDVDMLERIVPTWRAADVLAADKVLESVIDRLRPVVRGYPEVEPYGQQLKRVEALRK